MIFDAGATSGEFHYVLCTNDDEQRAAALQAERDALYRSDSPYQPADNDQPWVGELGEQAFTAWLERQRVCFEWLRSNPLHEADFVINGQRIDCKTSKRKAAPLIAYTCGVSTRQVYRPVEWYFFLTYEFPAQRMWLLGGMMKDAFMKEKQDLKAGEQVHADYTVRAGNEISNVPMSRLVKPAAFGALMRLMQRS